eukprot:5463352-Alexandrium_andersonii.AAC.1
MSASLVGSEMCIRDSYHAVRGPRRRVNCGDHEQWGRRRRPPRGCTAVSYTHLTLPTICSV